MGRALLAWTAVATLMATTVGLNKGDAAPPDADRLYEAAQAAFEGGANSEATAALEKFVHDFPKSPRAPEALYQQAIAYTLAGRTPDAQQVYDRLVKDHFDSPWTEFVLATHYDADKVGALADQLHSHGRQTSQAAEIERALKVYQLYRWRFLDNPGPGSTKKSKEEVAYCIADCQHLVGHDTEARALLAQVRDQDKDGKWGKLAALRLGDEQTFKDRLEDLIDIDDADSSLLLLELSDKYLAKLDGELQVKCLFYRAHCLANTERQTEALALYRKIEAEHGSSRYAAEAAFALAEGLFGKGDFEAAKAAYLHVGEAYPHAARAALAREWAAWIDEMASSWHGVEELLAHLVLTASGPFPPLSLSVDCKWGDGKRTLQARVAYRDDQHMLLQLAYGPSGFLIVNNSQGAWFQAVDQSTILRVKKSVPLPLPGIQVTHDPVKNSVGVNWAAGGDLQGQPPTIAVPTSLAPFAVGKLRSVVHLHRQTSREGKGRVVYRVQKANWRILEPATFDVTVDGSGEVRDIHGTCLNGQGEKLDCKISGVSVGEQLPDSVFAFSPPKGAPVRDIDELNSMDVMGALMRLIGALCEQVNQERKKG